MFNTSLWLLELQISLYPHVMFIQSDCFFWFQDIFWKLNWISRCGIKTESICEHCSLWLSSFPVAGTVPLLYSARRGGGGGRGTHLYKPYRYAPPQRVWYLGLFGLKTGILVWNRVWFSNYGSIIMKYLSFQFQMNKNDAFEEFFCLRSNLSNYDIISD